MRFGNNIHCSFIFTFLVGLFLMSFFLHTVLSNTIILKQIYLIYRSDPYAYTPVQIVQGVMAMKRYSTLPNAPELLLHRQMQFSVIFRTPLFCERVLPLCKRYRRLILSFTERNYLSLEKLLEDIIDLFSIIFITYLKRYNCL